ncbi:MAG: MltA domain-containing protein [Nitrospinales bacterium]
MTDEEAFWARLEPNRSGSHDPATGTGSETTSESVPTSNADADFPGPMLFPEILADDLEKGSLIKAINNQLDVFYGRDLDQSLELGDLTVTLGQLKDTLEEFLRLLRENLDPEEFSQKVREKFIFYPAGLGGKKRVVFTGYYTPVIQASRVWRNGYDYPLYRMPGRLLKVNYRYSQFYPGDFEEPGTEAEGVNYTREDIDGRRILNNLNLEIAWLKNDMERYFLHIQGSGILEYADGSREGVQYMGSNGYPYQGIGSLMLRDGVLPSSQGSMQGIKKYFEDHPQDIPKYLFQNKRYIFFQLSNENPRGASGAEVVGGRSIATDLSIYPAGALGFIMARKPTLDNLNEITGWEEFSRFVINQDTGSAIRGPGRADLYFGVGNRAGEAAGHYMESGKMIFLIKK